jgi:hypothetical protein
MRYLCPATDRLCDERRLAALARLLPAYLAFDGLADGWNELLNALKATLKIRAALATRPALLRKATGSIDLVANAI